jgi:hypothetical protein
MAIRRRGDMDGHVARMEEIRNINPDGKRPFGKRRHRCEVNVIWTLIKEDVRVAQDRVQ